jgi:GMP synthase (glutamine-hydrolysing)
MFMADWIAVVDFGGQYCHLIARRIRQLGVFSKIVEPDESPETLEGAKGIILSGSPHSVYGEKAPKLNPQFLKLGKPVLGLCYGHQLIAYEFGGRVSPGKTKEYGKANLEIKNRQTLFDGLGEQEEVWMSHGDTVEDLPKGFEAIASTPDCANAAVANIEKNIYGLQFHPEVTHTPNGMKVLENFVIKICQAKKEWDLENFLEQKLEEIKEKVGDKKVFLLASGGVDSNVVFAMLNKALPLEKVYGLHVDTGFMRKEESNQVKAAFEKIGYNNFHVVDAEKFFLEKVKGLTDPEEKREAIGQAFLDIKSEEMKRIGLNE